MFLDKDFIITKQLDVIVDGLSKIALATLFAPIARVKHILMTQDAIPEVRSGEVKRYNGSIDCFRRIYREQGVLAFWRGHLLSSLRYYSAYLSKSGFFIKGFTIYHEKEVNSKHSVQVKLLSGAATLVGRFAAQYPSESVHASLISNVASGCGFIGEFDLFWQILVNVCSSPQGFMSIFDGFVAGMLEGFVKRSCFFMLLSAVEQRNPFLRNQCMNDMRWAFLAGNLAQLGSQLIAFPLNTVRRRLQIQVGAPPEKRAYKGIVDCFQKIFAQEGVLGFFTGFQYEVLDRFISCFILVGSDHVKRRIRAGHVKAPLTTDQVLSLFNRWDLNKDGFITRSDVVSVLGDMTKEQARHFIKQYDRDGDGKLSFEEFKVAIVRDMK